MERSMTPPGFESMKVTHATRYMNLSLGFLEGAIMMAKMAKRIERRDFHKLRQDGEVDSVATYFAYVTGAVFMSTAFVGSSINELYVEAIAFNGSDSCSIPGDIAGILSDVWKHGISRNKSLSVMDKVQFTLALARAPLFDLGANPAQDYESVVALRNALTHYVPEESAVDPETGDSLDVHKFEKRFGRRFGHSPFYRNAPFFPERCISSECAVWVIKSSTAFYDEFYRRLGRDWDETSNAVVRMGL